MTFRFSSAAHTEISSALEYYEEQEKGLGLKFLNELEAAIGRVVAMPHAWKALSPRTRRCLLHRFPFGVIYQIMGDEILIVAVMDLRRDPESWRNLL
jgi:plasmid stabilization system protein ParE